MRSLEPVVNLIRSDAPRNVFILTGAGISAESGIPTFRGPNGLWKNFRPEQLATPEAFQHDPALVWEWYESRRAAIRKAQPNRAHKAIARLQQSSNCAVTLVTQNVDGLHLRAGSLEINELHGNIFRARCIREGTMIDFPDPPPALPPRCRCGSMLRPDVVWFGEMLPPGAIERAASAAGRADVALVIGTSALVYPAAGLISLTRGMVIEINPDQTAVSDSCTASLRLTATEAVPALVSAILGECHD